MRRRKEESMRLEDLAISINSLTFSISFPFLSILSVLVFESTPAGFTARIASATLSGPNPHPPAKITGIWTPSIILRLTSQS